MKRTYTEITGVQKNEKVAKSFYVYLYFKSFKSDLAEGMDANYILMTVFICFDITV